VFAPDRVENVGRQVSAVERRQQGAKLWLDLETAGAITPVSLTLPDGVSYDKCESLAAMFGGLKRTTSFLIGDLLLYAKREHGEAYAQLAEATKLAAQTISNLESVCNRVPPSVRREMVPFHVHAEVAALEPKQQDKWLKLVEKNNWTRQQLRDEMHGPSVLPPVASDDLAAVARALVQGAKEYGQDFLVSRDSFMRLQHAIGETE